MAIAPVVPQRLEDAVQVVDADLRRYCRSLARDEQEAADLAQEALVRSLPRLRRGDLEPGAARAYVRTAARNLLISDRRRPHASPAGTMADAPQASPDLEPPEVLLLDDQRRRVRRARARLAPRQQAVLQLRDVEGRPYGEIGARLGLNENGVAQLLSRARRRLRSEVRLAHVDRDRLPAPCRPRLAALVAEAEGELRGPEQSELHAHLECCRSCQGALAALRSAPERVRVLGPAGLLLAIRRLALGGLGGAGATAAGVVGGSVLLVGGIAVAHQDASAAARPPAITRSISGVPVPSGGQASGRRSMPGRRRGAGRAGTGPAVPAGHGRAGAKGPAGTRSSAAPKATGNGPASSASAGTGASPGAVSGASKGSGAPPGSSPSASTPSVSTPSVSTPAVSTPAVSAPSVSTPSITTPGVSTPVGTVPPVTVPSATVPGVTVPGVTVPGVTVPTVTVPSVTVTVPTVTTVTTPTLPHLP
jgi:RNA polymerase sigma factor (sigma-70 family)